MKYSTRYHMDKLVILQCPDELSYFIGLQQVKLFISIISLSKHASRLKTPP